MLNVECSICDTVVKDTHPTCGEGWDVCESCRAKIVDSVCQDIPLYCRYCHQPLNDKDYMGTYNLMGDATHLPGKFWVFKCGKCSSWSRCHMSTELSFTAAIAEIKKQREQ